MRKAFTADVSRGHTLVVADYGQLELRLLAHMANCKSMLEAFKLGGDFHSRTALNMYEHIKAAVDKGALPVHVPHDSVPLSLSLISRSRTSDSCANCCCTWNASAPGGKQLHPHESLC